MSWLSIVLQGAKAFAVANPKLTQELVQNALDTGIQLHQQYEAQQAANAQQQSAAERSRVLAKEGIIQDQRTPSRPASQNLPGA